MKRAFDILAASVALLVLVPVLLITAGLVLLFLGRPVLFAQQRPGLHGRPFRLYKFRTMHTHAMGGRPESDEQRLSQFGRWLRDTSLDELPELFNVLMGEMSLVGPRPLLMEYLPLYTARQARRHEVRPGITGWAQVNGRNAISWEQKFEHDIWYVEHRTFLLDLWILMRTVGQVFGRHGVSHGGHATMPRFTGSETK